jgi:N-acetylneuraminic acid mutarotase
VSWGAPIASALSEGDVNAWQTASNTLPSATTSASSVTYNGYVYEIGGQNSSNIPVTSVSYAPLNSDGSVGTWTATTSLAVGIFAATSVVNNGYVYEIGGENVSGTYLATDYYAKLNPNGSLGSWTATTSLPHGTALATSVVNNGYVYEIGGVDRSGGFATILSTVSYAPLNSDGSVGSWVTTTSLPISVLNASSIVYNGYVYEIGGYNASNPFAPAIYDTVYYAPLNSDGSVGTWQTASNTLPQGVYLATSVVNNGYVYEIGGDTGSANLDTVYYAPLNSDGSVGTWQTASNTLPATIISATSIVYNNYVYEISGYNSNALSTIYYATAVTSVTSQVTSDASTGSSAIITSPTSTPTAPNTGFGIDTQPAINSILIYVFGSSGMLILAVGIYRLYSIAKLKN